MPVIRRHSAMAPRGKAPSYLRREIRSSSMAPMMRPPRLIAAALSPMVASPRILRSDIVHLPRGFLGPEGAIRAAEDSENLIQRRGPADYQRLGGREEFKSDIVVLGRTKRTHAGGRLKQKTVAAPGQMAHIPGSKEEM